MGKWKQWWDEQPRVHMSWCVVLGLLAFWMASGLSSRADALRSVREHIRSDMEPVPRRSVAFPDRVMLGDYECTQNCSGHLAGWRWAALNNVDHIDDCGGLGPSDSFHEGCALFVDQLGYPTEPR